MFRVEGFCIDSDNCKFYMVTGDGTEAELLSESDLKFLTNLSFRIDDLNGNPIRIQDDEIVGVFPDMTDAVYSESDDYSDYDYDDVDDGYDSEAEDALCDDDGNEPDLWDADDYDNYSESEDAEGDDSEDDGYTDFLDYDEDDYSVYAEDEDDEEASTVEQLYSHLNESQIQVLRRYYLWYSQRLFTDAQKDPTLGIRNAKLLEKKKEQLAQLRGKDRLWHYAGFISFGRFGAATCTLGHPLKYMHLAWDVSKCDIETAFFGENYRLNYNDVIYADHCIRFGEKCISDFFEVSKECRYALHKAQSESIKDMGILLKYYEDGVVDDVIKSFNNLDEFISRIKLNDVKCQFLGKEPIMPGALSNLYMQFREVGLPPTKTMIQLIRDYMVGWTEHKFVRTLGLPKSNFLRTLSVLYPDNANLFSSCQNFVYLDYRLKYTNVKETVSLYLYILFTYKLSGAYEYDGKTNKDEGGSSKQVLFMLDTVYYLFRQFKDIEYTYEFSELLMRLLQLYTDVTRNIDDTSLPVADTILLKLSDDRVRLRDLSLTSSIKEKLSSDSIDFLANIKLLNSFRRYSFIDSAMSCGFVLRSDLRTKTAEFKPLVNEFSSLLEKVQAGLPLFVDDYSSAVDEYLNEKIAEKEKELQESAKESGVSDEDSSKVTLDTSQLLSNVSEMMEYLKDKDLKKLGKDYSFHRTVYDTCSKQGKEPSYKQGVYIKQMYMAVVELEAKGAVPKASTIGKVALSSRPDINDAISYALRPENNGKFDERTMSILKSIQRFGSISERQMKYAEMALDLYEKDNVVQGGDN